MKSRRLAAMSYARAHPTVYRYSYARARTQLYTVTVSYARARTQLYTVTVTRARTQLYWCDVLLQARINNCCPECRAGRADFLA
jgi:hypothetical protein